MKKDNAAEQVRILGISLSSRGFGYAVMEGSNRLVDYGKKTINKDKNARALAHIQKIMIRYQPGTLALLDVNAKGICRHARIKGLHRKVVLLAKPHKIRVVEISGKALRNTLLGNAGGTKHELAELLAKQFTDELASRLPPKRRTFDSEDARMDIFDAVELVVAIRMKMNRAQD